MAPLSRFYTFTELLFHSHVSHCTPPSDASKSNNAFTFGATKAPDPATSGYLLNHVCLLTPSLTRFLHFYTEILGMRHIFTYDATPRYQISYVGYPSDPTQTSEQILASKNDREGLLEVLHPKSRSESESQESRSSVAGSGRSNLSHVGIQVPDLEACEKRLREFGVKIVKGVGQQMQSSAQGPRKAYGLDEMTDQEFWDVMEALEVIGWKNKFLLCEDWDGNVVEIQQR